MATLEERLERVEFDFKHYKTESIRAYGDLALEFVMYKALTEDSVKRLIRMEKTLDEHTALLHKQGERQDRLEAIVSEHTAILNEHTAILNEHTVRFDRLETRFDHLETRFDHLETRFGHLETRFGHLETTLAQILARLPEKP